MNMATITNAFALVFISMGLAGFYRSHAPTSLIPTVLGVLLWICAEVAFKPSRRKQAMHAAAVLGLLGLAGSARGLLRLPALWRGERVVHPLSVIMQSMMAVLCLVFIVLCVISFIQARRNRPTGKS
jgi:hypothetical protein